MLPSYLTTLGASQTFVGTFNILGILLIVLVVVFFGRSLVSLPRVATLRWGYVSLVVASLLSWVFSDSLGWLVVFKILGSVGQVFSSTLMVSVLFDLTPPEKRTSSLALFSIAGMLTNPVSSIAGEAVLRSFGGPGLFLLSASLGTAALLWSTLIREPPARPVTEAPLSFRAVVVKPEVRSLLLLTFLFGFFYTAMVSFLPRHTQETLGEANLSAFLIPFSLISVGIRLFLGREMDRRPPRRFLHLSFLSVFVAQVFLLLPPTWLWMVGAGLFYGLGHSILFPLLNTLFVQVGGEQQKSVYSNVYLVVNLVGAIIMTPLLGAFGDWLGFRAIITVLALVALASFFLVRGKFPKPSGTTAEDRPFDHNS